MSITTRSISTGEFRRPLMENDLRATNEKLLWLYLRQCEACTMSGFYPLSIGEAHFHTAIPHGEIIEGLLKLDTLGAIAYDDGYIYLFHYPEETGTIKPDGRRCVGWEEHLDKVKRLYRGKPENRAWRAFQERFAAMIEQMTTDRVRKMADRGRDGKFAKKGGKDDRSSAHDRSSGKEKPKRSERPDEFTAILYFVEDLREGKPLNKWEKDQFEKLYHGHGAEKLQAAIEHCAGKKWQATVDQVKEALAGKFTPSASPEGGGKVEVKLF